jgi:toxin CcdB
VLQTSFLDALTTRLVAPLYEPTTLGTLSPRLVPLVSVDGVDYVVAMPQMAGIPKNRLGGRVASLAAHRDRLVAAVDFLLGGF